MQRVNTRQEEWGVCVCFNWGKAVRGGGRALKPSHAHLRKII